MRVLVEDVHKKAGWGRGEVELGIRGE